MGFLMRHFRWGIELTRRPRCASGQLKILAGELVNPPDLNPGNGRSLFGLWKTMTALGRTSEAERPKQQFHDARKDADV